MPPIPKAPRLPDDQHPETLMAPADPVMQLLNELVSKVDAIGLDMKAVHRRVANLASEVNAAKNQAAAGTSEARAAHAATVVTNDMVNGIARILEEQTNAGLAELDRKQENGFHQLKTVLEVSLEENHTTVEMVQSAIEMIQDHAALPADEAHGRRYTNGNGHDPEVTYDAES
jgi:hypothetical protein